MQLAAMFSCFTGRSAAAGPPGVNDRSEPPNVPTQAAVPGGDTLNPSLLRPIIGGTAAHTAPLSATTSL